METQSPARARQTALTPRDSLIALLSVVGKTPGEIADYLGTNERRVRAIMGSPLFQAMLVQASRDAMIAVGRGQLEKIVSEGPQSISRLTDLRDQHDDLSVARAAADSLLDRNPFTAKLTKSGNGRGGGAADVNDETLRRVMVALAEAEGKIIPALAITDAPLKLETVDEAIVSLEQRERELEAAP